MRKTAILAVMALSAVAGAAQAQTTEQETQQQQQPASRVFSLPPGDPVEEQADPTVQGPRVPGMAPPRAVDPDAPRRQEGQTRQTRSETPPARTQVAPIRDAQAPTQSPGQQRRTPTEQATRAAPTNVQQGTTVAPPSGDATAENAGDVTGNEPLFDIGPERPAPTGSASRADPALVPSAEADPGFPPIWLIGLALLLAGGLGYVIWQRRSVPAAETGITATTALSPDRAPEPEPAPQPEPEPESLAAAPASAREPPAAPAPPQIELDFEPLEARWSEAGLAIKFRLYLRNISDRPVHDIAVHLGIRSADQKLGPSQGPAGLPNLFLETLRGHDLSAHEGEMRLDENAIQPVLVEGREMVLPIVDIMPRYRDSADNMRKIQVALLVGRERNPPAQKLAPLAVRTALGPRERLGCRVISLPGAAQPVAVS